MEQKRPSVACPYCGTIRSRAEFCPACGRGVSKGDATLQEATSPDLKRPILAELVVVAGGPAASYALPEGLSRLGRGADCAVRLDNLQVSLHHLTFTRSRDLCRAEVADAVSPVLVNDHLLLSPLSLYAGDRIRVGGIELELRLRVAPAIDSGRHGGDEALIRAQAKSPVLLHGVPSAVIPFAGERITLGRGEDRDLRLPHPMVSRRHARLEATPEGWRLQDTGSTAGTFVNGKGVHQALLQRGDRIQIGPYLFVVESDGLHRAIGQEILSLEAAHLVCEVPGLKILDDVSLQVNPGEFVGLLGPSGSGKTTLLDALNGLRPATRGEVRYNGVNLYSGFGTLRDSIGYVPQDDILHRDLQVREALTFSARLRLPEDMRRHEIDARVTEVLETLGLQDRHSVPVSLLSGGQRKRASIGVELLSDPQVLFLDEPTAGLDPATGERMMQTFRRLASQGRTVVCSTHVLEHADLFDRIFVLSKGRLVFSGTPAELLVHFGIDRMERLYALLEEGDPPPVASVEHPPSAPVISVRKRAKPGWQWLALLARQLRLFRRDWQNTALMLIQPAASIGLTCLVSDRLPTVFYMAVLSALWLGCSNAITQIVREWPIYARERMVTVRLFDYVLSKVLALALITALHVVILLAAIFWCEDHEGSILWQAAILFMTGMAGVAMGLAASAVVKTESRAVALVPVLIVPQILFTGMFVPFAQMNAPSHLISFATASRWSYQGLSASILDGTEIPSLLKGGIGFVTEKAPALAMIVTRPDCTSPAGAAEFIEAHQGERFQLVPLLFRCLGILTLFFVLGFSAALVFLRLRDPCALR